MTSEIERGKKIFSEQKKNNYHFSFEKLICELKIFLITIFFFDLLCLLYNLFLDKLTHLLDWKKDILIEVFFFFIVVTEILNKQQHV